MWGMALDSRVRAIMQSRGWTQVEAAKQLGVTQSWICRVLRRPPVSLALFAQVSARLDELEREQVAL